MFFEIFLSIFIWKETGDLALVAWFNIIYLLLHTLSFHAFAGLVKAGNIHLPRIAALLGSALVYLGVFLLQEHAISYVLVMAALMGIFNGMYWISYQILRFDLTHQKNRGNYTGLETGAKISVDILMPAIGGAIIVANFYGLGYLNIFLLGGLLFLASAYVGNVSFPRYASNKLHITKTFKNMWSDMDIRKGLFVTLFGAMGRGGAIARTLIPLLIFSVVANELELGTLLSILGGVAIISSVFFGKKVKYAWYKRSLLSGGIFYVAILVLLYFFPSLWLYLLFGALAKIIGIFINIPRRVISENLIENIDDSKNHRVEYIVIREWFNIGLGRVSSFILVLSFSALDVSNMTWLFLVVSAATVIEVLLLRSIKKGL